MASMKVVSTEALLEFQLVAYLASWWVDGLELRKAFWMEKLLVALKVDESVKYWVGNLEIFLAAWLVDYLVAGRVK